jgi:Na+/melibiose symporter-like transporter
LPLCLCSIILVGENIAGLSTIPLWMWLAKRIGKHKALAIGAGGMALLSAPIPLIPHDQPWLYAACIIVRGASGGALALLVGAMLADVVDLDKVRTGRERTALYYGMAGTISKVGVAVGILVGTALPSAFGFEPSAVENSDRALFALLATYAWIPMVIMACAAPFFWFYPLTEKVQKALRSEIESNVEAKEA